MALPPLGDVGKILGARYRNFGSTSRQFQPTQAEKRLVLNDFDPGWERIPTNALIVQLLVQPDYLDLLPVWLSFNPEFSFTEELINTIIDLDDPRVVRLLSAYQPRLSSIDMPLDEILRGYLVDDKLFDLEQNGNTLHIARSSKLSTYYTGFHNFADDPEFYNFEDSKVRKLLRDYDAAAPDYEAPGQEIYHVGTLLYKHLLLPKAERDIFPRDNVTRLAVSVFNLLLNNVMEEQSRALLLDYAIQSVSPLCYTLWVEKFGRVTVQYLVKQLPDILSEYDFGDWGSVYHPEIRSAVEAVVHGDQIVL